MNLQTSIQSYNEYLNLLNTIIKTKDYIKVLVDNQQCTNLNKFYEFSINKN